jgi:hypothetical protein
MAGQFFFVTLEPSLHNPQQFAEYARGDSFNGSRLAELLDRLRQIPIPKTAPPPPLAVASFAGNTN